MRNLQFRFVFKNSEFSFDNSKIFHNFFFWIGIVSNLLTLFHAIPSQQFEKYFRKKSKNILDIFEVRGIKGAVLQPLPLTSPRSTITARLHCTEL